MASLNDSLNEELRMQYREQIVTLQNAIDDLIRDPNKVVTLVNMGLSEDLAKNGDRTSSSLMHNGMAGGVGGMGIGVGGVLNMLPWPKPSADVQQIMLAAQAMTTQSAEASAIAAAHGKTGRAGKRKLNGEEGSYPAAEYGKKAHTEGLSAESLTYSSVDSNVHNTGSNNNLMYGGRMADFESNSDEGGDSDGENGLGGPDPSDNLRSKIVDIGVTQVQCDLNMESQRLQFSGPVQLAPLQRKKLRPNVTRKVVPLMEPDIGSNFSIEFIPQFILSILHKSLARGDKSLQDLENRLQQDGGGGAGGISQDLSLQQAVESVSSVGNMLSGTAPLIPVNADGSGQQMDGGMAAFAAMNGNSTNGQNVFATSNFISADFQQLSNGL
eukprot:gene21649-27689_t